MEREREREAQEAIERQARKHEEAEKAAEQHAIAFPKLTIA